MGNNNGIRRRRRNLLAADPHCHWCRRELREYQIAEMPVNGRPPDAATVDHLNSLAGNPHGRPVMRVFIAGRGLVTWRHVPVTVLSCFPCNQARAIDEERGLPAWTPGCRANTAADLR